MNNLQFIIKDNSRYAMHVAVELCQQGDFDSVTDAFRWLMQECDDSELGSGTCKITATATNNLMYPDYMTKWYELSCGHSLTLKGDEEPKWCAVCGKAVER